MVHKKSLIPKINYKNKSFGDLYIIVIPNETGELLSEIKQGILILNSYKW